MGRKCSFVPVALISITLLLRRARVQCIKHCLFPQAINAFVHATDGTGVAYGDHIQLLVVDAEAKPTDFLRNQYIW